MASFVRLARQSSKLFSITHTRRPSQAYVKPIVCFISTSKKHKDAAIMSEKLHNPVKVEENLDNLEAKEENWISYGYSLTDREGDEWTHHLLLFSGITISIIGGGFFMAYMPDYKERSWVQREAYLELDRRERLGLPLVDGNVVDPDKIELPSDEELGDFDVII